MKEYIVTLKNFDDLGAFYDDMETSGGNLFIPNREVSVALRRPISRNTHYYLTQEEANELMKDERVESVILLPEELNLSFGPSFIQESNWDKSNTIDSNHGNWGLLRCAEGVHSESWGSDGIASISRSARFGPEGKNVDVLIIDGLFDPTHPEFADASGNSRVNQYNWYQHNVGLGTGTYTYGPYIDSDALITKNNDHGCHVAGTVAGNKYGWARQANIYNIYPFVEFQYMTYVIDYVRAWHAAKPINPETGRKNPTIVNNSYGFSLTAQISNVTQLYYRGTTVLKSSGFTKAELEAKGIPVYTNSTTGLEEVNIPVVYTPYDADIIDAINDGIIMVGAAGNSSFKIDVEGGLDYDNYVGVKSSNNVTYGYYCHRGMSPTEAPGMICVGAVESTAIETKATFSNCGPRVDIFAPGRNIVSSVNSSTSFSLITDYPTNSTYKIGKISGTSMASPQVTGVLACALETYPSMTPAEAKQYIINLAKQDQLDDTGGSYMDFTSLQGAANKYLYAKSEKAMLGDSYPKKDYKQRPSSGMLYPRSKNRRTIL